MRERGEGEAGGGGGGGGGEGEGLLIGCKSLLLLFGFVKSFFLQGS